MRKEGIRVFIFLFGLSLIIRFLWLTPALLDPERIFDPDSYLYHRLAVSILTKHTFTSDFPVRDHPEFFRTPGYPMFISFVYAIFGINPKAVVVVQAIIGALIPFLAYLCFSQILPKNLVFWGSVFLALVPEFSIFSSFIFTETLYIFVLVFVMLLFFKSVKDNGIRYVIGTFGSLAIATYVRPEGVILVPVLLITYLFSKRQTLLKALGSIAAGIIVYLLLLSPWVFRNYKKSHRLLLSTVVEVNTAFIDIPVYKNWLEGTTTDPETSLALNWAHLKEKYNWEGETFWSVIEDPEKTNLALRHEIRSLSVPALLFFPIYKLFVGLKLLVNPGLGYYRSLLLGSEGKVKGWVFLKTVGAKNFLSRIAGAIKIKFRNAPLWFIAVMGIVYVVGLVLVIIGFLGMVSLLQRRKWLYIALPILVYLFLLIAAGPNMNMRYRANYEFLFIPWWGYGLFRIKEWLKH